MSEKKITKKTSDDKLYTTVYRSSMSALKETFEKPRKKIEPTAKKNGLREEFKKIFLPLLIDVFELRQMIKQYSPNAKISPFLPLEKPVKSPKEILTKLKNLQLDIQESQKWTDGVVSQIAKALKEAEETLSPQTEKCKKMPLPLRRRFFLFCVKFWKRNKRLS